MVCLVCENVPNRECTCSNVNNEVKEKKKRKKTMKEIFDKPTLKTKRAK